MQSTKFRPVPFAVGGVAHRETSPATLEACSRAPARRFGPETPEGFRPMFFTREAEEEDEETRLRREWDRAVGKAAATAYAEKPAREKGALVDLPA